MTTYKRPPERARKSEPYPTRLILLDFYFRKEDRKPHKNSQGAVIRVKRWHHKMELAIQPRTKALTGKRSRL